MMHLQLLAAGADLGMREDDGGINVASMRDLEGCKIILQAMTHKQRLSLDMPAEGLLQVCKPVGHALQSLRTDPREARVVVCDGILRDAVLIYEHLQPALHQY